MTLFIKKTINLFKEMGIFTSFLYLLAKLIKKISRKYHLYYYVFVRQKVHQTPLLPPHKGSKFKFQVLEKNCKLLETLPRPNTVIKERFTQGYRCIAATKNDKFVGCIWLALDGYIEDEARAIFSPQPTDKIAWDFDVYIDPAQRLSYLFPKLWDQTNIYLKDLGFEATDSRITGFNIHSINSHKKLGAKVIAKALYIKAGNIQVSLSSTSPYLHLSCKENVVPEYKL